MATGGRKGSKRGRRRFLEKGTHGARLAKKGFHDGLIPFLSATRIAETTMIGNSLYIEETVNQTQTD